MQGDAAETYLDFQVDPGNLNVRRTVASPRRPLEPGEVRFRVDSFALTANNITYAAMGSVLGYLEFFPAGVEPPWRRIPVMGHGAIIESAHPDIATGGRYFGFFPMAGEHVLRAERRGSSVWDAGAHRAQHAATYRQFQAAPSDGSRDDEDVAALLRGLFATSFLVEDFLFDNGYFGGESVIVTSASSKTSIALGYCLQRRGMASVGFTSARSVDAVLDLGCYDRVLAYGDVTALDSAVPSVVVDMANNGDVISSIHRHFGEALRFSSMVGATHHGAAPRPADLPGPPPEFFFAPRQIEKRAKDWGAEEFSQRLAVEFGQFASFARAWLRLQRGKGGDAVDAAYAEVLAGTSAPTTGHVLSLSG